MSEGQKKEQTPDLVGNLKSEMNRKLDNYGQQLASFQEENKKTLENLIQQLQPKKKESQPSELGDLIYEDPNKAMQTMREQIRAELKREAEEDKAKMVEFESYKQDILTEIVQDYPEVSNMAHPLTKKTVELHQKMPKNRQADPLSYKMAVLQAAAEMSIKPASQRSEDYEDDFTLGGSSKRESRAIQSKQEEKTKQFAAFMGLDVNDKKTMERINRHNRENWIDYK